MHKLALEIQEEQEHVWLQWLVRRPTSTEKERVQQSPPPTLTTFAALTNSPRVTVEQVTAAITAIAPQIVWILPITWIAQAEFAQTPLFAHPAREQAVMREAVFLLGPVPAWVKMITTALAEADMFAAPMLQVPNPVRLHTPKL